MPPYLRSASILYNAVDDHSILDSLPYLVWVINYDMQLLYANHAALTFSRNYPQTGLVEGGNLSKEGFLAKHFNDILVSGKPQIGVHESFPLSDGQTKWFKCSRIPSRNAHGAVYGLLITMEDVTEEHRQRPMTAAERNYAEKNHFLANMSHELITPLNAVIGYSEMLTNGLAGPLNQKQNRYTQNIASSGHHLLDLVNNILDLSQVEMGKISLSKEYLPLEPFIRELIDQLTPLAMEKGVNLFFDTAPELEGITADVHRLRQIFFNLVNNGIKFNQSGGYVIVRLRTSDDKQWLTCDIEDNGIGMPRHKLSELFTGFFQIDASMSRRHEGAGLGLALTKHLIELHGGTIRVCSEEGVGSVFSFQLPLGLDSAAP